MDNDISQGRGEPIQKDMELDTNKTHVYVMSGSNVSLTLSLLLCNWFWKITCACTCHCVYYNYMQLFYLVQFFLNFLNPYGFKMQISINAYIYCLCLPILELSI